MTGLNGESALLGEMLKIKPHVFLRLDMKLVSEANAHEHWRVRQRRANAQKLKVQLELAPYRVKPKLPAVVTITRLSRGRLDTDNLQSAGKFVRDAIAEWLGCGDSPKDPITWVYEQRVIKKGYGVEVEIRGA